MPKRSLQASPSGIKKAKQRFISKDWTQEDLADAVGIKTRQPIWRFFSGKAIEKYTFIEICIKLGLDWEEITLDLPLANILNYETDDGDDLDKLVQFARSQRQEKINHQCGILQLLDISHPVSIAQIYIDVNILEQIPSQQWLEISALDRLEPEDIDRFGLGKIEESQISGMEAVQKYSKLRLLGKPGSGKSTFLRHLAIECNHGRFAITQIPIFISLRDFAESLRTNLQLSLLEFIHQEFITSGISQASLLEKLLHSGRILLLIDGMDEVQSQEEKIVMSEIRRFVDKYHRNQFVATCRTASQKLSLKGFTDVEIAPFTQEQIAAFAQKWFVTFSQLNIQSGETTSDEFIDKLELPENWGYRRLITTPLFLHLACSIFHRQGKFPIKQAEFYKQGMDLLLGKWDEAKGIERDQVYRGFVLPEKLKLLSQIAAATFEQGQYFFEENVIEKYIDDYMQTLAGRRATDPAEIHQTSESILRAIESQHGILAERARGIFSFSYLALQEYFTARKIVASHNLDALGDTLHELVRHVTDPHWREIFLLTASMLRSADSLMQLMKQQIDALITDDPYLQEFLTWASQKSENNPSKIKAAASRAFYQGLNRETDFALACNLDQGASLDVALKNLLRKCELCKFTKSSDFVHVHLCAEALNHILDIVLDIGFHKSLQQLSDRLPNKNHTISSFEKWCSKNYAAWVTDLQKAIATHRDISNQWEFNPEQQQLLQRYYEANRLLLDCLHSNCEVTESIRLDIEATLLLPQKELEIREWQ